MFTSVIPEGLDVVPKTVHIAVFEGVSVGDYEALCGVHAKRELETIDAKPTCSRCRRRVRELGYVVEDDVDYGQSW